jgi:hypothetical protein
MVRLYPRPDLVDPDNAIENAWTVTSIRVPFLMGVLIRYPSKEFSFHPAPGGIAGTTVVHFARGDLARAHLNSVAHRITGGDTVLTN